MRRAALKLVVLAIAAVARAEQLPPGPGRALVLEGCVQCHDLRPILSQKKAAAAWRRTVHEMVWRGAPLFPGEARQVADYLAQAFGPDARPSLAPVAAPSENERLLQSLPAGPGRELLLSACTACHGLQTTLAARKSEAGWKRSVEQMAALGARLNGREQETLARYLAGALSEKP
jgi:mono/diheme cytochrome c family protein